MMKFIFSLLFISMLLGCSGTTEELENETKSRFEQELLGYWILVEGTSYAINDKGTQITTATFKPNTVAHEFFKDKTAITYDLTGSFPEEKYNWELKVTQSDNSEIDGGTLTFWNDNTKSQAGQLFFDDKGRLTYDIETLSKFSTTGKARMYLKSKKYEAYPHKENWSSLVFEKR